MPEWPARVRIGPGEVLTRVLATGICASDVKTYLGGACGDRRRSRPTSDWSVIGDVKELTIHGARLVSHQLPLREYAKGIDIAHEGNQSIKVVLVPRGMQGVPWRS
jgi:threonine dehydrogenase-like Zn-dependent dehydrogenase